jgi:Tetratricopeptide repeat
VTLRKALDPTESQVAGAFADRPLAEGAIREMLGLGYLNVGEAARAVQQFERALALREATPGAAHADADACRNQLAVAYRLADRTTEADRVLQRDPNSAAHASSLAVRGAMLLGRRRHIGQPSTPPTPRRVDIV